MNTQQLWNTLLEEGKKVENGKIFVNDGRKVKDKDGKSVEIHYLEKLSNGKIKLVAGGAPSYYGRFNQGVVTLNLPDVAFSSKGNREKFWELMEERSELIHRALKLRTKSLEGTHAYNAPILWQHGALARLDENEPISPLLYDGYSTISFGYAGLYECVKYMTVKSHSDEGEGEKFGLEVMQFMNDKCAEWKKAENIDYSVYGTPKLLWVA